MIRTAEMLLELPHLWVSSSSSSSSSSHFFVYIRAGGLAATDKTDPESQARSKVTKYKTKRGLKTGLEGLGLMKEASVLHCGKCRIRMIGGRP